MIILGDVHLEKRFPYTNKKTQERWLKLQRSTLDRVLDMNDDVFQVGDLLDDFEVSAATFVRAAKYAERMEAVVAGNHDVSRNEEKSSALQLINDLVDSCPICYSKEPMGMLVDGLRVDMVSHQVTQEDFETNLLRLLVRDDRTPRILLLHCNYGDPRGSAADTDNYLRPEIAEKLLGKYDLIFSGHEHNGSQKHGGRVIMTGSILPMNFGEMTDKYIYRVTQGGYEDLPLWSAEENYRLLEASEFILLDITTPLQFIEVVGSVDMVESVAVSKKIAEWYLKSDTIIAIKNSTEYVKLEAADEGGKPAPGSVDWVKLVMNQLNQEEQEVFMLALNGGNV